MTKTAPSATRLAKRLYKVGLAKLAERALNNEFHDFLSPHSMPVHTLVNELERCAYVYPGMREAILEIRRDVMNGVYDTTKEEAQEWALSSEGQEALRQIKNQMRGNK